MTTLADRLNELFRSVRRPGTSELWNNETAAWEISRTGPPVSAAYLSQLRTGKRLNPSARHLAALAGLFQVAMESFFPLSEASRRYEDAELPSSVDAAWLVMLLDGMSSAGVGRVEQLIAEIRAVEELPPAPPRPAGGHAGAPRPQPAAASGPSHASY